MMDGKTDTREAQIIRSHLHSFGRDMNFNPLAARDYGSRARGLESEDSDYDVFFIFVERPSTYALGRASETYERTIQPEESSLATEIEFHGWNLKKFVGSDGLAGSNPTAIEFCAAKDSVYSEPPLECVDKFERMLGHARSTFKPYALINHYRSMAASNYGTYIEDGYTLADGVAYNDLLSYADPPWAWLAEDAANYLSIDESETEIGTDAIDCVGTVEWSLSCGTIDIDTALDRGLVEPTTTDPTVKRHLSIAQSLCKARLIEHSHECPPMDADDLLDAIADTEWLPQHVLNEIRSLVTKKRAGQGNCDIEHDNALHDWIEDELDRSVEPQEHVQRQPDRDLLYREARLLYELIKSEF